MMAKHLQGTNVVELQRKAQEQRELQNERRKLAEVEATRFERSVLAGMISNPQACGLAISELDASHFRDEANAIVFEALSDVYNRHGTVDLTLLAERLRAKGSYQSAGGMVYLSRLLDMLPAMANFPVHVRELQNVHRRRRIDNAARKTMDALKDPDLDPTSAVQQLMFDAAAIDARHTETNVDDFLVDGQRIFDNFFNPDASAAAAAGLPGAPLTRIPHGVDTPFEPLNRIMGPAMPGDFILIGAKSKVGKSFLANQLAVYWARAGANVVLAGLEMGKVENLARILAQMTGVPHAVTRHRRFTAEQQRLCYGAATELASLPLTICEGHRKLEELRAFVAKRRLLGRCDILIVDNVQCVQSRSRDRIDATKNAADALRSWATDLGILVVGINQFKLGDDPTKNARPTRFDLFGGTDIITFPTHILLLHRPDPRGSQVDLIVEALRHGMAGDTVRLNFQGDCGIFSIA